MQVEGSRTAHWSGWCLFLAFATAYAGEFDSTVGVGDWLAAFALVGALGALGFVAGVVFGRLMTEPGHRPVNVPTLADERLQEVR